MALLQDLRYVCRTLLRERSTSAAILTTLTLGISATAVMFGVVDQLLLRPPAGIGQADAVRRLYFGSEASPPDARGRAQSNQSYPTITALRDGVRAFSATAATHLAEVTLGAGPGARQARIELVSAEYFALLQLVPASGQFFTRVADRTPEGDPVVVVSHAFWENELGADPAAVGRTLLIEGKPLEIVGVAPAGFSGIDRERVDFWAPPGALGRELFGDDWSSTANVYRFQLVARLAPGATDADVSAQATALLRRILADGKPRPDAREIAFGVPLNGLHDPDGMAVHAKVGLWLLGVAAVVVMIACANVGSLLLARALSRRREIAVRVAIGASRARLLRQLFTESAVLSAGAAAAALLLTYFGSRLVQQLLLPGFAWEEGVVDGRVLVATLVVSIVTTLATGVAPALHALSSDVAGAMRPAQAITRRRTGVMRSGLVVMQVTLCVVLLVGAGLFARSLAAVRAHEVGIDIDRVIRASLPPATAPADARTLYPEAMQRVQAIPGIRSVALSGGSAHLRFGRSRSMTPEGMTREDTASRGMDAYFVVTPDFFATLGTRITRGRDLTVDDDRSRARVAVVTEALAGRFWPGAEAVGRCVSFRISFNAATCTTIVGVVENVLLHNRTRTEDAQVYVLQSHPDFARDAPTALLIRTTADASALVPLVRSTLQSLRSDMGYVEVETVEAMLAPQLQPWRLGASMFFVFGAVALLIAAVGLYSTLAFAVSQRRQEIGIRMALGASDWNITATIGVAGAITVASGICSGLIGAAFATQWLSDLLYHTSPHDPIVFAGAALVLMVVGLAAGIIPARRAALLDPLAALRTE